MSNPVYGVKEVDIEVMIGGSGERVQTSGVGLFDFESAQRFKAELTDRVAARFKAAGIVARKGAGHAVLLEFWGREIPDAVCKPQYVAEVAASFHYPAEVDHDDVSWAHTVIEIAPAEKLSSQLIESVAFLMDELLKTPSSSKWY